VVTYTPQGFKLILYTNEGSLVACTGNIIYNAQPEINLLVNLGGGVFPFKIDGGSLVG